MSILSINTDFAGQIGANPRRVRIISTDSLATVTTAGYLNNTNLQGFTLYPTDFVDMVYSYNNATNSGTNDVFLVGISAGVITLSQDISGGNVLLPVVSGNIAVFSGTSGLIADPTGIAVHGGSIQAGKSGTAGSLISYPATASKGSFQWIATANSGNTVTSITNQAMGQASAFVVPDPANANARLLAGATATPFTSGNFPVASGTGGLMVDSGLAAANIQNKTNIIAARTANIGGAGAGPISVAVTGLTAASVVTASIQASSNTVSVGKVTATSSGFDILFTADPGATCTVNYHAFIAAQ